MVVKHNPRTLRLSDRDRRVIDHVARYRVTTIPALLRAVLPGISPNAVSKIANRLTITGHLKKFTLLHPSRYFVLGEQAAAMLGRSVRQAPGSQSLPTDYAVLAYATLGGQARVRLLREELKAQWPWLPDRLAAAPYCRCLNHSSIELVRVDLGGSADHVARKCAADLRNRLPLPAFAPMVAEGTFRLVVITATREKSAAIRRALNRHEWPNGLAIHLSVVSQLLSLTGRAHHA